MRAKGSNYRVVVHGLPTREAARRLAAEIALAADGWVPTTSVEPDDVETARVDAAVEWGEGQGAFPLIEQVSLHKDTPRKGAHV